MGTKTIFRAARNSTAREAALGDVRHDWGRAEVEGIYRMALPKLVFQAQTVHRANHAADPAALKEHLINRARTFIFSTAVPSYMAEQIRAALVLARGMDREREKLMAKARRLASSLRSSGWDSGQSETQIVPLIVGENEQAQSAAEHLQEQGFAVGAVRPPTVPQGSARLRFSLTSGIPDDELVRLENSLNSWSEKLHSSAAVARV